MSGTLIQPRQTRAAITEVDIPVIASRLSPITKLPVVTISLLEVAKAMVRMMGTPARRTTEWELPDGSRLSISAKRVRARRRPSLGRYGLDMP